MNGCEVAEGAVRVPNQAGLHARPAGRVAALVERFRAEVELGNGSEWVDASSVLSILSLGLAHGALVRIRARGEDALEAVRAVAELIEGLGDDQDFEPSG